MPAYTFFVVYYEPAVAERVEEVCDQINEALAGQRVIVTAPDGMMVEQFTFERGEQWEE